jgi:hypothetical protein
VLRAGLLRLGGSMLGGLLSADRGHRGPRVRCGNGHQARFAGYRDKSFDTVLGLVTVTRAWYHCAGCGHGLAPRDTELGVARESMSPGLAAMNDIAAAAGPFAGAARLLEEIGGIRLTAKRVERAAEASGTAVAQAGRERARLTAARKLVPMPPSPLPDKLYAVIDGTGVPMTGRETAGRHGKGEDGRARTREVKLAVFFTQDRLDAGGYPVRDRASTSIIATFEPASVFADLVKAEGIRRGADHVRQLTIIGDGAAWIWGIATAKFPEATQIVDLYHAREHLHALTRSLEFMLLGHKDEWLAARLEDLDYGYIDGIEAAVRRLHHRPPLPRGQQHLGSRQPQAGHSDTHSLTSKPGKLPASHREVGPGRFPEVPSALAFTDPARSVLETIDPQKTRNHFRRQHQHDRRNNPQVHGLESETRVEPGGRAGPA